MTETRMPCFESRLQCSFRHDRVERVQGAIFGVCSGTCVSGAYKHLVLRTTPQTRFCTPRLLKSMNNVSWKRTGRLLQRRFWDFHLLLHSARCFLDLLPLLESYHSSAQKMIWYSQKSKTKIRFGVMSDYAPGTTNQAASPEFWSEA